MRFSKRRGRETPAPPAAQVPPLAGPNEGINLDMGVAFIAIPKNGTTTVREQTRPSGRQLVDHPHLDVTQMRLALDLFCQLSHLGHGSGFPTRQPSTHEVGDEASATWTRLFKFAAVRNPWARTLSIYLRREGVPYRDQMSFTTFVRRLESASDTCVHPTRHRSQVDWLRDRDDKIVVDYVYKLEEFDSAVDVIAESTDGALRLDRVRRNANPTGQPYHDAYDRESRERVRSLFSEDIERFEYRF